MATAQAPAPDGAMLQAPPATEREFEPSVRKPWTWAEHASYFSRVVMFKVFVRVALNLMRTLRPGAFRKTAATYTKYYSALPSLDCRIFLPDNFQSGTTLPLYIDVHGGGFVLGDPGTDDRFCHYFANLGYCVASINYRKAPFHPWPIPVQDTVALAKAVLADPDLPVDHTRVAMGGFSAGGNLILSAAQFEGIKDKVKALVPIYPSCDLSGKFRGEFRPNQDGKPDLLLKTSTMFIWSYVPRGTDRTIKTLSPVYANRKDLPQSMYFVAAEYDVLCREANVMAKRLAGVDSNLDPGTQWDINGIRWEQVPNVQHGFTHVPMSKSKDVERQKLCEAIYHRIDDWLKNTVFK